MPKLQLYDMLLQFTVFQGMSRGELMQLVTHTKLGFMKFHEGKRILKEGERCDRIYFLVNGTIRMETHAEDLSYSFCEEIPAPYAIQQESIFGQALRFRSTVHAQTDVNFITIDKKETVNLTENFLVIRLNMLNLFATQAQKLQTSLWAYAPKSLEERIARFLISHCQHPAGHKTVSIYMERLATEVNDSRLDVSRALNRMQTEGLLRLSRGRITIPDLEKLTTAFP